jgi:hypothetical protein
VTRQRCQVMGGGCQGVAAAITGGRRRSRGVRGRGAVGGGVRRWGHHLDHGRSTSGARGGGWGGGEWWREVNLNQRL